MGPIASVFGYIMDVFIPDYQQHGDHEYRSVYHPVYHYHKVTVISSDDQTAGIVKTYVAYEP